MKITPKPTTEEVTSFNHSVLDEKVNSTRVILVLGVFFFLLYTYFNSQGLSKEKLAIIYPVRATILIVLTMLFVLTFKKELFSKHYNKLVMFGYISSGVILTVGFYVAQPGDYSYDLYFAALMILVITAFSWNYLPIKYSILICAIFTLNYVLIKVFVHKDIEGTRLLTLVLHVFYLTSVAVIASQAQRIRDTIIYKNLRLHNNLKQLADEQAQEAKRQEILANLDDLTGIPNRLYITECLQKALKEAEQTNTLLILIFMDLDGFKEINDTYGHGIGDKVLKVTAQRLNSIREGDYLARLGGDEFLMGFKADHFSKKYINTLCANIKENISTPMTIKKNKLQVGVSIGYATYPDDGNNIEALMKNADKHMYIDKKEGKKI
ncbi:GGDEF domain-containing protein [uncultured Cocleimonas sp.]|uniref:GGDEF domain-containing protein n=1 Tax=uncultured Cocleimonas sp. TaxID=1051587 RepID=UPI00260CF0A3|nr:GGDEF domain-containing protein [uncultured Cocleimonas sp.]